VMALRPWKERAIHQQGSASGVLLFCSYKMTNCRVNS
jgi:hypothetical protein